eukprot:scaffold1.g5593.t1
MPAGLQAPLTQVPLPPPQGRAHPIIVWLRRDLRLADNPALAAALQLGATVVPVYIWSPEEEGQFQPGRCSRWWLAGSLASLEREFDALGSRLLYFRSPDARSVLAALAADLGARTVFFNHLYDPISMVRDNEVKASLAAAGVFCQSFNADVLCEPWDLLERAPGGGRQPFSCFEAFWAAHTGAPAPVPLPLPPPARLPPVPPGAGGLSLAELGIMSPEEAMSNAQLEFQWRPGSAGAHAVLQAFVSGRLHAFDRDRAKTDRASTSRLSPHIHYGEISARTVYHAARAAGAAWAAAGAAGGSSVDDFLCQLGYREYSRYLSFHFPFTHERALLEHLRAVPWNYDQRLFKAWRQGRTGYPLVDAAMRELWSSGWMHNRMRVVAASFLVKNLLVPWHWGLKHYWDALVDADLECDTLGWQYCAGCLADAHDFGYMIDLATECKRFDPDGNYVRRWLPVLARLPARFIHAPWEAPEHVLDDAGVELGVNYPLPVVTVEESKSVLAATVDVVERSKVSSGTAATSGPFRPATTAPPNVAPADVSLGLGVDRVSQVSVQGPWRPLAATAAAARAAAAAAAARGAAPAAAVAPAASEQVESNVAGGAPWGEPSASRPQEQRPAASAAPSAHLVPSISADAPAASSVPQSPRAAASASAASPASALEAAAGAPPGRKAVRREHEPAEGEEAAAQLQRGGGADAMQCEASGGHGWSAETPSQADAWRPQESQAGASKRQRT